MSTASHVLNTRLTGVPHHVAADPDPLPRPVGEVGRAVEGDLDDVAREELRLQDVELEEGPAEAHDLCHKGSLKVIP